MRTIKPLLWSSLCLGLLALPGCVELTDDDEDGGAPGTGQQPEGATAPDGGPRTSGPGLDGSPPGTGTNPDGSTAPGNTTGQTTTGQTTGLDGGVPTGATLPASCIGELPAPTACVLPDPLETLGKTPVELNVDPCGLVNPTLTAGDEDFFWFTTVRSDPVLVEMAYTTDKSAELNYRITNQKGEYVAGNSDVRGAPTERSWSKFVGNAGGTFSIEMQSSSVGACQPYALRVNTLYCTDQYEDNDSRATATKLVLGADQSVTVEPTMYRQDDDFFEITVPKNDPVLLTGSYTVDGTGIADLNWRAEGPTGNFIAGDSVARASATEEWSSWVRPDGAGAIVRVQVSDVSSNSCTPYKLKLDAAGCTDAYEDNDIRADSKPLPLDQDVSATLVTGDTDFYAVSAVPQAGLCTITYSVPAGSKRDVTARLDSAGGNFLASGSTAINGETHVLTVKWAQPAATLQLSTSANNNCMPYTIKCVAQ